MSDNAEFHEMADTVTLDDGSSLKSFVLVKGYPTWAVIHQDDTFFLQEMMQFGKEGEPLPDEPVDALRRTDPVPAYAEAVSTMTALLAVELGVQIQGAA